MPLSVAPRALAALFILWTLAALGGLLEGRCWALPLEVARLVALASALAVGAVSIV